MSVAKVMEISSRSPEGFEHAIRAGLERAGKTLDGIKGAWIKEQKVKIDDKGNPQFIVQMKVTFELRD